MKCIIRRVARKFVEFRPYIKNKKDNYTWVWNVFVLNSNGPLAGYTFKLRFQGASCAIITISYNLQLNTYFTPKFEPKC